MPHAEEALKVTPLGKTIGCEVSGIDWSKPISDATLDELNEVINEYAVVMLRKTSLDDHSAIALGRRFGDLDSVAQHYVYHPKGRNAMRVPLFEIFDVSNLDEHDQIVTIENDPTRTAAANGNATWHADGAFNPRRTGISILRGVEIPPKEIGGHTEYADTRTAYDDLSDQMKDKIEDYVTCNSLLYNRQCSNHGSPLFAGRDPITSVTARHRLVQTHEGSGRKNLYLTSYASHIEGLPVEEGQQLLNELRNHCKKDKYRLDVHWENANDVAIWDNTAVLHRATKGKHTGKYRRDMRRVSVFDMTKWGYGLNKVADAKYQAPSQ